MHEMLDGHRIIALGSDKVLIISIFGWKLPKILEIMT